jgi:primosomal protein N' (replication factor Y)
MYAEIVLPISLNKSFSYIVPPELENRISIGMRVDVPFGRRIKRGYVINITDSIPEGLSISKKSVFKRIYKLLDNKQVITDDLIQVARWMSDRYACSPGEALNCVLPVEVYSKETSIPRSSNVTFTTKSNIEQTLRKLNSCLRKGKHRVFVLGDLPYTDMMKVYMEIISQSLKYGECIFLTPEILFISQIVKNLDSFFNSELVRLWHSKITYRNKYRTWLDVLSGKIKLILGTRSAVFVPLKNLKLIIIDNESDQSYKQIQKPAYNTIDVAIKRAKICNAVVVVGSRVPSVETYYRLKNKEYSLIPATSPSPLTSTTLLPVKIVDLRKNIHTDRFISNELKSSIEQRLARNELSIVFLNRRGYSNAVMCRSCGSIRKCPNCAIPLIYHHHESILKCHYCTYSEDYDSACRNCSGKNMRYLGTGTERIVSRLSTIFPQAHITRIDRDSIKPGVDMDKSVGEVVSGKFNIIVGTQLLLSLLPFLEKSYKNSKFTLLAFYDIDTNLYLSDFRAAEHTFRTIYQLSDLLAQNGELLIQTHNTNHYLFKNLAKFNWKKFYNQELRFRKELNYPPFSELINVVVRGSKESNVTEEINRLSKFINENFTEEELISFASFESKFPKLRKKFRGQILLKTLIKDNLYITSKLKTYKPGYNVHISIDVNPYEIN